MTENILTFFDQGLGLVNLFIVVLVISFFRKIDFKTKGLKDYKLPLIVLVVSLVVFAAAEFLSFINYLVLDSSYLDVSSDLLATLFVAGLLGSVFLAKTSEDQKFDLGRKAQVRDGVTGLHNTAFLQTCGSEMFQNTEDSNTSFSSLFIEIDHFDSYSNSFGHDQCNVALKLLATSLRKLTRAQDSIVRYRKNKFVILTPTNADYAKLIANRIHRYIEQNFTPENQPELKEAMTVSIGAATLDEGIKSLRDLLEKADMALYQAKATGRNRVVVHLPEPSENGHGNNKAELYNLV